MTTPSGSSMARSAPADWAGVRRVLVVVLLLNAAVAAVKVIVGIRTGALTVLGAALESTLDMLNNVIGVALVGVAARGPDEDHPYGHDKFETLGMLAIVGFLSISCFELLREGITALATHRTPHTIEPGDVGVIAATLVVNVFVVWYERAARAKARERVSGGRRLAHRRRHLRDAARAGDARPLARRSRVARRAARDRGRSRDRVERSRHSASLDPDPRRPGARSSQTRSGAS